MKIVVKYNQLDMIINHLHALVVGDKLLHEDLKNFIFEVKDNQLYVCLFNGLVVSKTKVEVESLEEAKEGYFQLKAKDFSKILSSFKGLKKTEAANVELYITEEANIKVHEVPKGVSDLDESLYDLYKQVSEFRLPLIPLKPVVKSALDNLPQTIEEPDFRDEVEKYAFYLKTLYPLISKETRDITNQIVFGKEHVYVTLLTFVSLMENKLEGWEGFRVNGSGINFIMNLFNLDSMFTFKKVEKDKGIIELLFEVGNTIALVKANDLSKALDLTNFLTPISNGVVTDKVYISEVLNRLVTTEGVVFDVQIEQGQGVFEIRSKNFKQQIPVLKAKGEGRYTFHLSSDVLLKMMFKHSYDLPDMVYMYLEVNEKGLITLSFKDETGVWVTRMNGISPVKNIPQW